MTTPGEEWLRRMGFADDEGQHSQTDAPDADHGAAEPDGQQPDPGRSLPDTTELRAQLAELRVTHRSPDRLVTVVARPGGVESIDIAREARENRPDRLSRTVLTTVQDAVSQADNRCAELIRDTMGSDRGVTDVLRGRLPSTEEDTS